VAAAHGPEHRKYGAAGLLPADGPVAQLMEPLSPARNRPAEAACVRLCATSGECR
jgi:hypothetical protein